MLFVFLTLALDVIGVVLVEFAGAPGRSGPVLRRIVRLTRRLELV